MSKTQIVRKSFNGGEIAPDLWYRSDLEAYHSSCKSLLNMNVTPWGGAERRPPTELLAKIDTATYGVPVKYLPFKFSLTETFHVVFTDGSGSASPNASTADIIVFDSTGTLVTLAGASIKILDTVYDPDDLLSLHFIQVNDFIYMTCGGDYPVQSLSRFYNEVELGNRWTLGEFDLKPEPLGDLNVDESSLLSIGVGEWDSTVTYAEGDVVNPLITSYSVTNINAKYIYPYGNQRNYRVRISTSSGTYPLTVGDKIYVDDFFILETPALSYVNSQIIFSGFDLSGTYTVAEVESASSLIIDLQIMVVNSDVAPTFTLGAGVNVTDASGGDLSSYYQSKLSGNTNNVLTDTTYWEEIKAYRGSCNLSSSFDVFSVGDVGRIVAISLEENNTLNGEWVANLTSEMANAQGSVTLTTEGGAWGGLLELQESSNGGGTWETIGSIRSISGSYNGSIEREVSKIGSLIRVKLSEYSAPNPAIFDNEGCIWKVSFTNSAKHFSRIVAFTDSKNVEVLTLSPLLRNFSSFRWQLGEFSETTGYPYTLTIHDERMIFGGNNSKPNTVWASRVNDWTNFMEGATDVSPYTFTIKSDSFDLIRWLRSTRELMVGTENSESTMGTLNESEVISATNVEVKTHTYFGSANLQAIVTADLVFFAQGQAKRVRSSQYDFGTDQYLSSEMSIYAHHITEAGIKEMSFTRDPYSLLFFTMEDGKAVAFTYERDNAVKGWARLELGGSATLVSAASNYTPAGDSIFGIVLRNGEYTLEGFTKTTAASVYLDGQIQFVDQDYSAGVAVPISSTGAVVVRNDALLDPADYTIAANVLTIPGATDGTVTIGWPTSFEIAPTNPIETGDFGTVRRVEDISLYLLDSGGCDVSINGTATPFQDAINLAATERLDGEYELSADGGYDSKVNVVLSGNHHRPFKIVGMGFDVSRHA